MTKMDMIMETLENEIDETIELEIVDIDDDGGFVLCVGFNRDNIEEEQPTLEIISERLNAMEMNYEIDELPFINDEGDYCSYDITVRGDAE